MMSEKEEQGSTSLVPTQAPKSQRERLLDAIPPRELGEDEKQAWHLCYSGFFADAKQFSQAVVKVQLGRSLGLDPLSAMTGLFLSGQGKLCMTANLMASIIKKSKKYDYRVLRKDDEASELGFYERDPADPSGWRLLGVSDFTRKHAQEAGLTSGPNAANYKKYWRNMAFARALSNGQKWFCPDALGGSPVYLPDELPGSGYHVDGDTLEVISTPAPVVVVRSSDSTPSSVSVPVVEKELTVAQAKLRDECLLVTNLAAHLTALGLSDTLSDLTDEECTLALRALKIKKKAKAS